MPVGNHTVEYNTHRFHVFEGEGNWALLRSQIKRYGTGIVQLLVVLFLLAAALATTLIILFENASRPPDLGRERRQPPYISDGARFPCPDYSGLSKTAFAETLRGELPVANELRVSRILDVCHVSVF